MSNWQSEREDYLAGAYGEGTYGGRGCCLAWAIAALTVIAVCANIVYLSLINQLSK